MGQNNIEPLQIDEDLRVHEPESCISPHGSVNERRAVEISGGPSNICDLTAAQGPCLSTGIDDQRIQQIRGPMQALTELHQSHPSMEFLLQRACRLIADLLDFDHCCVGWLDDSDLGISPWASHTRAGVVIAQERVLRAFAGLVTRHVANPSDVSPVVPCHLAGTQTSRSMREVVAPLRIENQIVGYVCGLKPTTLDGRLSDAERSLFDILSQHISAAIEAQRTREMLDSPYVALVLTPLEREYLAGLSSLERPFMEPIDNPERLVRKVARRFFADLHQAGFELKQIMCVAAEILDSLLQVQQKAKQEGAS